MSSTVIYIAACTLSLLISSSIALVSWQRRKEPGAFPFFVVAAGQASWTFGLIAETISPTLSEKIFWDSFQNLGWMLGSTVVIIFAYEFTRTRKNVGWVWWALALLICLGITTMAYIEPLQPLFRSAPKLVQEQDFTSLSYGFPDFMNWLSAYSYLAVLFAAGMLALHMRRMPKEQRPQVGFILAGLIFPLIGGILSSDPKFPSYLRDISPFTFGSGNALIAIGLMRYQLFGVSRYAKEQVVEMMETMIIAVDSREYISFMNPITTKTLGLNSGNIGRPVPQFIRNWFNQLGDSQTTPEAILKLERDGVDYSFVASLVALKDNRKNLIGKALILSDITQRLQTEQTLSERTRLLEEQTQVIQKNTEQLQESNQHAQRRAAELQALAEVSRATASINELEALLPTITKTISANFGFYHVGIFLADNANEYALLSAANSEGGQRMLERGHKLKIGQAGIVGNVVASGIPRIALDTGADAIHLKNPNLPETRSEMALPLRAGNRITGALDVQSVEPNAFSHEDVKVLSTLADQVSIAIQNARLFDETKRSAAENQLLLQQYARTQWSSLLKAQQKIGYRYSGKMETLTEKTETPSAASSTDVPIIVRGQVIGTVNVRPADGKNFSKDELDIIHAATERAAIAAENVRLLEDSQKRAAKEQTIGEISAKISSSVNLENIFRTAMQELYQLMPDTEIVVDFEDENQSSTSNS
jgi:GAF domain-containing protein